MHKRYPTNALQYSREHLLEMAIITSHWTKKHTLLRMISGAKYSGVPHNVQVRPLTRLAKPKSVILR